MSVQSIMNNVAAANVNTVSKATEKTNEEVKTTTTENTGFDETAVVYEKSPAPETSVTNKNAGIDRAAS